MTIFSAVDAVSGPVDKWAMPRKGPNYDQLAAEIRELAAEARNAEARQELSRLAEQYDRLAQRAAKKKS